METNDATLFTPITGFFRKNFSKLSVISKGGFGTVMRVTDLLEGQEYAVKKIIIDRLETEDTLLKIFREVKWLARLDHKNIVRYFHSWIEEEEEESMSAGSDDWEDSLGQPETSSDRDDSMRSLRQTHTNGTKKCARLPALKARGSESESTPTHSPPRTSHSPPRTSHSLSARSHSPSGPESSQGHSSNSYWNDITESGEERCESSKNSAPCDENENEESWDDEGSSLSLSRPSEKESQSYSKRKKLVNVSDRSQSLDKEGLQLVRYQDRPSRPRRLVLALYIKTQLYSTKTLADWLAYPNRLVSSQDNIVIFFQIVHGLEYIHRSGCIHRDIKPANIFLSEDGNVKIGDFGLATLNKVRMQQQYASANGPAGNASRDRPAFASERIEADAGTPDQALSPTTSDSSPPSSNAEKKPTKKGKTSHHKHTSGLGTFTYAAPEQMDRTNYDEKVDIYSLGIILYEMHRLFFSSHERHMEIQLLKRKLFLPNEFQQKFPKQSSLILSMVNHTPALRPSARDLCVEGIRNGFTHDFLPKNLITFIRQARLKDMIDFRKQHPVFGLYPGCVQEINNGKHFRRNSLHLNTNANYQTHLPLLEYHAQPNDEDRIQQLTGSGNIIYDNDIYDDSSSSSRTSTITNENNIFLKSSCGQDAGSRSSPTEIEELGSTAPVPMSAVAQASVPKGKLKVREYLSHRDAISVDDDKKRAIFEVSHASSSSASSGITSANSPGMLGLKSGDEFSKMSISNTCSNSAPVLVSSEDRILEDTNSLLENSLKFPGSSSSSPHSYLNSLPSRSISATNSSSSSYLKVESVSESNEDTEPGNFEVTSLEEKLLDDPFLPPLPFLVHSDYSLTKDGLGMQLSQDVLTYILSLEQRITLQRNYIERLEKKNSELEKEVRNKK